MDRTEFNIHCDTHIFLRRLYGVVVYWFTTNLVTSVEMIEKSYSDAQNTSPQAISEITNVKRVTLKRLTA